MAGKPYTQADAAQIFRQFGEGDPNFTLYMPDGTPADALNTQSNATPESALDWWSTHPDALAVWNEMTRRANIAAQAGEPPPSSESLLDQIEADINAAAAAAARVFAMPWGWLALGALAIFILPPMLEGEHKRQRR
jgi:hypothetical protein